MTTVTFTSSGSWSAPTGVITTDCQCWGEGGNGGTALSGSHSGGGGGGGEFAEETTLAVTAGNNYTFTIGGGGSSTNTSFPGDSVTVTAHFGASASGSFTGAGGSGSTNSIHHNGGAGGSGIAASGRGGGGGGSSAGTGSAGAAGANGGVGIGGGGNGGTAPSGGGNGGNGGGSNSTGSNGSVPGGGAGGGGDGASHAGGSGASGQITLTYFVNVPGTATLAGVGTLTASSLVFNPSAPAPWQPANPGRSWLRRFGYDRHQTLPGLQVQTINSTATLSGVGTLSAFGGLPNPVMVNQWQNNYGQGATFGSIAGSAQSCVVPLTPGFQVGPGSGTPTPGNWLFTLVSWTQFAPEGNVYVGIGDDIHSYWREYPASGSGNAVRTTIGFTPNIARTAGNVYVAPSGEVAAINVIVIEISGLGAWDTFSAKNTNFVANGTSIGLSIGSIPSQTAFTIGAVGGDNVSAGLTFTPGGWTTLTTESQTNGVDHTADNILAGAFLPSTSSTVSVTATSSSENLSSFILQVLIGAPSPVPNTQNPNWPVVKFEAAFGAGFNTPNSELTWTDLSNRLWDWNETTGIQFQLGQIQATNLQVELDNFDGALSPLNTSSIYYPNVIPGTPVRLRIAMDSIGGVSVKRWYVIQRNAMQWAEVIEPSYRRQVTMDASDIWSVLSSVPSTFYRAEIYNDKPYSWYPMDDQPGENGVLPTTLLNAASGNSTVMNIVESPNGVTAQDAYSTTGSDLTAQLPNSKSLVAPPPNIATYTVGANAGWMYGDPPSSASSFSSATGNPVETSTGSASWQQTGLLGTSGSNGWFLSANDSGFPGLSGGVTVKGWFNCNFYGSGVGFGIVNVSETDYVTLQQPHNAITVCTLATNSAPVAVLQLDTSGHLNLITYNGGTGTSNSIYSSSDLRNGAWISVDIMLTTTTWNVLVNGGITANVSGSATGMTSAWTYLILNGDMGTSGGTSQSAIQHSGNMSLAHWTVFPYILPTWRLLSHYTAAISGFGLLPAPVVQLTPIINTMGFLTTAEAALFTISPDGYDGSGRYGGNGGQIGSGGNVTTFSYSMLMTANAGSYSSAPSARAVLGTQGGFTTSGSNSYSTPASVWASLANADAPSYNIYTSASAGNETEAAVILGQGDIFSSGYGGSAVDHGVSVIGGGSGASPPVAATPLGDSVAQRIERLLLAGRTTSPNRCIDPVSDLVQAPGVSGSGTQTGASIQAIQQSDYGLLFVDNNNKLNYWQRSHLAGQYNSPVWTITPNAPPTFGASLSNIPYHREIQWITDPQRVWNVIDITPFSPSGAQLPSLTPTDAVDVQASQLQYGAQPLAITNWLQSKTTMQSQANWLFIEYGVPRRRIEDLKIEASSYPAAFPLVVGINIGDIVTVQDWALGNTGTVYTYRVTMMQRRIMYGEDQEDTEASVTLTLDYEPTTYY